MITVYRNLDRLPCAVALRFEDHRVMHAPPRVPPHMCVAVGGRGGQGSGDVCWKLEIWLERRFGAENVRVLCPCTCAEDFLQKVVSMNVVLSRPLEIFSA